MSYNIITDLTKNEQNPADIVLWIAEKQVKGVSGDKNQFRIVIMQLWALFKRKCNFFML